MDRTVSVLNRDYVLSLAIFTTLLFILWQQVYIRRHLARYIKLKGFKPGSTELKNTKRFASMPTIVLVAVLLLLVAVKIGFDMSHILKSGLSYKYQFLVAAPLAVLALTLMIKIRVESVLGSNRITERNKKSDNKPWIV